MTHEQIKAKAKELGFKWMAMDRNGEWYAYKEKPVINDDYYEWREQGVTICKNFWKDSLMEVD